MKFIYKIHELLGRLGNPYGSMHTVVAPLRVGSTAALHGAPDWRLTPPGTDGHREPQNNQMGNTGFPNCVGKGVPGNGRVINGAKWWWQWEKEGWGKTKQQPLLVDLKDLSRRNVSRTVLSDGIALGKKKVETHEMVSYKIHLLLFL